MILTKEVFVASHAKTLISARIRFSAPSIEQNFYFVQLSMVVFFRMIDSSEMISFVLDLFH